MNSQPTWQMILDSLPNKENSLRSVLKTRHKFWPIFFNGRCWMVRRGVVRDYLRKLVTA